MEKQCIEEAWLETQAKLKIDPNMKRQTHFMVSRKEDSDQIAEKQKKELREELRLLRLKSQQSTTDDRQESFFEKLQKRKREIIDFH
jgi:hypothetical protein